MDLDLNRVTFFNREWRLRLVWCGRGLTIAYSICNITISRDSQRSTHIFLFYKLSQRRYSRQLCWKSTRIVPDTYCDDTYIQKPKYGSEPIRVSETQPLHQSNRKQKGFRTKSKLRLRNIFSLRCAVLMPISGRNTLNDSTRLSGISNILPPYFLNWVEEPAEYD